MTTCPFCGLDPFHYVDIGVGIQAAAVECCGLGDLYFRGARPEITDDVTLSPDEFRSVGNVISQMRSELEQYREKFGELDAT